LQSRFGLSGSVIDNEEGQEYTPAKIGDGVTPLGLVSLFDYENAAETILPKGLWDFIAGGADDEITLRRNREAFDRIPIEPRFLIDVSDRDLSTSVLGMDIDVPVMIAPAGAQRHVRPEGDLATARAAARTGTIMIVATTAGYTIEEIGAATNGPLWYQLYHYDDGITAEMIARAQASGFLAICVTVDGIAARGKHRDIRNGFVLDPSLGLANVRHRQDIATALRDAALSQRPTAGLREKNALTWRRISWLRSLTDLPIVIKGIMSPLDAVLAVEHGVDGIVVSNHGGRLWDGTLSTIEALPRIAEIVEGRLEIYLDSGVRRGTDVLKALALGARAVMVGRPVFWGLAIDGEEGVLAVLEILKNEFSQAMAISGKLTTKEIGPEVICNDAG
jgi:isopentenyl diphosphate isomerase/L-lactate dehydrogenase-like FMN-dependent dehydrogenase